MKEYQVEIVELLSRLVKVKAENNVKAIDLVKKMYIKEEIILDDSDYVETNFFCEDFPSH